MPMILKNRIRIAAKCELARRDFFQYCNVKAPSFYKKDRSFLKNFCHGLQDFYESDDEVLVVNMPPRHGKSRTVGCFVGWVLGKNQNEKVMTGSYNETLSTSFSKNVRNTILEEKADEDKVVYSDVFQGVTIKRGDGAMNMWSLEGGYNNYLATSPTGTATGFGASILIIDDLIKSALEANNADVLEKHWEWYCFTGETLVKTNAGDKYIKNISIGDKVLTFNHSNGITEEKEVVRAESHLSPIYRLEFENGKTIECTENHKFYTTKGYISIGELLSTMRCEIKPGENILFSNLQKQSKSRKRTKNKLQKLWKRNFHWKEKQTDNVLFYGLQELLQSEGSKRKICWLGENQGYAERRNKKLSKMWFGKQFAGSSQGSQIKKQRSEQSDCSMRIMPFKLSQITRLSSNDFRTVYDIEVKDNHNFFVNGMLVHNCNTMLSRLEEGGKIIIVMTRWHSLDLAGRALNHYTDTGAKIRHISYKAMQEDGSMLCPEILSKKSYESKIRAMGIDIASANYQQEPIDLKGRLYTSFKTYIKLPMDKNGNLIFSAIKNYTDTADTGNDYLCSIDYGVYMGEAYVLNVLYTKDGMEITEPAQAKMMHEDNVGIADIESNNGGRGYSRNVERITKEKYKSNKTRFNPFFQSKNKQSRILSNSTWVMDHIYFPVNWMDRFSEYYEAMSKYQKEGKNTHDDAPDCTTGIAEKINAGDAFSFD